MKRISKQIIIIAIILALLMIFEVPVSALSNVIDTDQSSFENDISNELDEADAETSNIISEIEEERDKYSKTFRLENGNISLVEYSVPIHFQDEQGNWLNYDNTLKEDKRVVIKQQDKKPESTSETPTTEPSVSETTTDSDASESVSPETTNTATFEKDTENQAAPTEIKEAESPAIEESVLPTEEISTYSTKNSSINISYSKKSSENNMVFVGEEGSIVSWGYKGINSVYAKCIEDTTEYEGNEKYTALKNLISTVKYDSVYKDVDMELISTSLGVKENIIINSKDAAHSFVSEYEIGKLTPKQLDDRVIALFNDKDEVEYYINAEYMYDAQGEVDYGLKLTIIEESNGKLIVELTADEKWLSDSERAFPVTIDPTFITGQQWSSVQCTYINSDNPNTAYGYGSSTGYTGTIYTGTYGDGMNRSLLKMNNLPSLNKGDMIIDASVNLYLYNGFYNSTGFFDDEYVGVYEVKDSWNQSTVTWNNRPDYYSPLIDYVKFDESSEPDWFSLNITKLVKGWCEGTRTNYGIMLKSVDESSCEQCVAFFSSNYPSSVTPRPAFQITYRNNKGIEDYWTNTSIGVGGAGTLYVNNYSGALTFIVPLASTASPAKSAGISYVYNSYMAGKKDTTYKPYTGKGWRMSIHQTLLPSSEFGLTGESAEKYPYVYTDADGTDHYFYKKNENGTTKYVDEDGLDLELKINTNNQLNLDSEDRYVIIDKENNKLTFFSNGLFRTQRDAYDNIVRQFYSATNTNTITILKDASGNDISFETNAYNYAKKIKDPNNREVSVDHAVFGTLEACISRFTREDGTHSDLTYYDNNGLLKSVQDADGYKVVIYYDNTSTKKVTKIEEYGTDDTLGNTMTFDRSKYNTTVMQSSGNDGVFNNSDDIITTYQFDNCGRTKSVQTKTKGNEDLGAANYEYTSGTPNSSGSNIYKINRISSEHAVGANTYNYVKNHGFEAGSGWTNSSWLGSNTFTGGSTTEQKAYGHKSYKIKSTAYNNYSAGRAYQDITGLESGSTYTLSGYVKVTELSGNQSVSGAVLDATSFNSDGTTPDYYSETISEVTDTAVNNGWRRVSVTFTVPSNSNKIRVNIALKAATGTAYFDGIQLEKAKTAGSYNLLENSSFESSSTNTQPTSWGNPVGLTFSSSASDDGCRTTQKIHGSKSFKINGDVSNNKYISQTVPVSGVEDDTYIVSGWAKADSVAIDSGNTRKFKISIAVNYSDGTQKFKESADFNETISDWQFVSKAFNLSDGTSANKTPTSVQIFMNYSKEGNAAYFDNFSLVKEPSQSYTYDSKGNLVSVVSNAKQNSSMEYNTDNKLTKVLDPKGYSYEYTYNSHGYVQTAKTQNNAVYTYNYDDNGNVTQAVGLGTDGVRVRSRQTISYPGSSSSEYTVTSYDQRDQASVSTYNAKTGTLKSFKDPKNVVTSYTYNSNNDLLTSVSKDNHTVSYSYDSNYRNLTDIDTATTDYSFAYDAFGARTQTDVGNRTLATYTYNNGGLLTRMDYGNDDYVTYEYDKFGNTNKKYQNGTLAYEGITDNTGTVTRAIDHTNNLQYDYTYDSTDRLISSAVTNSNNNQRKAMFEYNFDLNNNMSKFITLTPTGHNKVLYTYGKDNLLTGITLDNSNTLNFVYDGIGRPTSHTVNLTNPLTTTYTYHGITSGGTVYKNNLIRTEKIGNGDFWYLYHYDANNNINRLYQNAENEDNKVLLEDYSYDALNQLENVNYYDRHERHEYTYDNGGNITEEKVYDTSGSTPVLTATNTYTYGDTDGWGDLLTSYNNNTITYDEIGNPLSYRDGISFTWSNGRQLQSYTKNNSTINYTYDSSGMRLSKDVGNIHYTYLYQNGLLVQETIGEKILDYSYTSGGQILSVRYKANANDSGTYYYYALNSRGDVIGLYDHTGALYAKYTYNVWGNPVSVTNANGVEITSPTDFANLQSLRYRSYYYDSDTGFYYLQSRYYDPITHRFINADGLVSTGTGVLGYNMFAYCENNPVNFYDSDGKKVYPADFIGPLRPGDYRLPTPTKLKPVTNATSISNKNTYSSTYNSNNSNTWNYKGWTYRKGKDNTGSDFDQLHIHIKRGDKEYIQNLDGTLHHKNKCPGEPPNSVKKKLKEDGIWDWDANAAKQNSSVRNSLIAPPDGIKIQSGINIQESNMYGLYYVPVDLCMPSMCFSLSAPSVSALSLAFVF